MIDIPEGITIQVDGNKVIARGPQGEVQKDLSRKAAVKVDSGKVDITADKALKGTMESVIKNMIHGVEKGYTRKLKVLYAHFPVSIEVKGQVITIKNFLGEKQPRKTSVIGNTKVETKGQSITVSGPDKEAVGQTAANLKSVLKIREKDPRIFQDGIYEEGE